MDRFSFALNPQIEMVAIKVSITMVVFIIKVNKNIAFEHLPLKIHRMKLKGSHLCSNSYTIDKAHNKKMKDQEIKSEQTSWLSKKEAEREGFEPSVQVYARTTV